MPTYHQSVQALVQQPSTAERQLMAVTAKQINKGIDALENLWVALKHLGVSDAATSMGAVELLSKEVLEGSTKLAVALDGIAEAILNLASVLDKRG